MLIWYYERLATINDRMIKGLNSRPWMQTFCEKHKGLIHSYSVTIKLKRKFKSTFLKPTQFCVLNFILLLKFLLTPFLIICCYSVSACNLTQTPLAACPWHGETNVKRWLCTLMLQTEIPEQGSKWSCVETCKLYTYLGTLYIMQKVARFTMIPTYCRAQLLYSVDIM